MQGFTAAKSLRSAVLGHEATPLSGPAPPYTSRQGVSDYSATGTTVSWEPSPLTPPTYTANVASRLSTVLNLGIILIMIKIKCLLKKRLHDLTKQNKTKKHSQDLEG